MINIFRNIYLLLQFHWSNKINILSSSSFHPFISCYFNYFRFPKTINIIKINIFLKILNSINSNLIEDLFIFCEYTENNFFLELFIYLHFIRNK